MEKDINEVLELARLAPIASGEEMQNVINILKTIDKEYKE